MLPRQLLGLALCTALVQLVPFAPAAGQQPEDQATQLAKKSQNPISDLTAIPVQFNFNTGGGFGGQTFFNLTVQPVIPVKGVLENWNIVTRTIVPYVSIPGAGGTRQSGLGDIQFQSILTPAKSGRIIWGVGPTFSFPTATASSASTGSWGMGPIAVALTMRGPWVVGGLFYNVWTIADNGGAPEVNQFTLQPLVNYNFGKGWAVATSPIFSANWDAPSGEEWTVPLGGSITKTTSFNGRAMSLGIHYYHNLDHPTASAADLLRLQISFLYPSRPPGKPELP
jgi:hypothetical protein